MSAVIVSPLARLDCFEGYARDGRACPDGVNRPREAGLRRTVVHSPGGFLRATPTPGILPGMTLGDVPTGEEDVDAWLRLDGLYLTGKSLLTDAT
jgi:hypothetical protein